MEYEKRSKNQEITRNYKDLKKDHTEIKQAETMSVEIHTNSWTSQRSRSDTVEKRINGSYI